MTQWLWITNEKLATKMKHEVRVVLDDERVRDHLYSYIHEKEQEGFEFGKMVELHYRMFGGQDESLMLKGAAAVEILILSLDILDDLQDQDDGGQRWTTDPLPQAMNLSTGLLMLSTHVLSNVDQTGQAVAYLAQYVLGAVTGQYHDLADDVDSEEAYMKMIEKKSGSLMACACVIGTCLATSYHHKAVESYAKTLGRAAQQANDLQDVLRLDPSNDVLHRKRTLPVLKLFDEGSEYAGRLLAYYNQDVSQETFLENKQEMFQWIEGSSAVAYARVRKRVDQLDAIQQLGRIDVENEAKRQLLSLMESI